MLQNTDVHILNTNGGWAGLNINGISEFTQAYEEFFTQMWMPKIEPLKEKKTDNGHVYELDGIFEEWIPRQIDYLNDYR